MPLSRNKVIIVGGGFAGLQLAYRLDSHRFEVLLIDKFNHHQFQPLFYQVATARLEPANISFPFRKIFQKRGMPSFVMDRVVSIDPAASSIKTENGSYQFDTLVLANGCGNNFFGNDALAATALTMKSTQEAIDLRNTVLIELEKMFREADSVTPSDMNIVIVGAGPTGVELAGAFAEMKRNVLPRDYPGMDFRRMKIYLLEGSANTLNSMSDHAKQKSQEALEKLGVTFRKETIVTAYDGETVQLKSGETIQSRLLIWAAGVKGNIIDGLHPGCIEHSRYIVDRNNKVTGYSNIYAVGDIALMKTEKYPKGHPQLANVAIGQARNLAKTLNDPLHPKPYEYHDKGSMATIGKHKAVVDMPGFSFSGFFAWLIWMSLHLMLILSLKNKLIVFMNWTWHYFTNDTSLRLIFKQGDKK